MVIAYQDEFVTLHQGTAIEVLRGMPEKSVHMAVTSPPYWGLRSYLPADHPAKGQEIGTEKTPDEYVAKLVEVFAEVWRVLRDDGTLWVNIGDSYIAHPGQRKTTDKAGPKQMTKRGSTDAPSRHVSGLKPKDLCMIPARLAIALCDWGWYLRQELVWAKCLSGGARVYARTQKGEMPMMVKDLVRLDPATVKLWNGERWTQAVSWWPAETGRDGAIQVRLRSGERVGCTPEHRWPTERGNVRADELVVGDVLKTTRLPEPGEPNAPSALPDEDIGWLVGMYLAEGYITPGGFGISGHRKESERQERLARVACDYDGSAVTHFPGPNKAMTSVNSVVLKAVVQKYIGGVSAKTKHLKVACWQRSNAFLFSLLRGYLEGDGHLDERNMRWRLGFTRNDALAADLRTLCARLGFPLTLNATTGTGFGKTWPIYRGEVRFESNEHWNSKDRGEVVAITRSRARRFWDIAVEDEPHLFALASGVLTHNSSCMPESVRDRCTRAHEFVYMLTKKPRYFYDSIAIAEPSVATHGSGNGFKRPQQLSRNGRGSDETWEPAEGGTRNARSVWHINPRNYKGSHFAVFPPELPMRCIKAGTSERGVCSECGAPWRRVTERVDKGYNGSRYGERAVDATGGAKTGGTARSTLGSSNGKLTGDSQTVGWEPTCTHKADTVPATVLDPFMGSGTTALAARRLGRRSIGIDLDAKSVQLLEERLGYQGVLL